MEYALLLIFPFLMLYSALNDLTTMTIPNWVSGLLIVSFFALSLIVGMPWSDLAFHAGIGFVVLVAGMVMFALNWVGGGDAKLIAATSLWMGPALIAPFLLGVGLFGGLVTLLIVMFRKTPVPQAALSVGWVARLHHAEEGVPYGLGIGAAGFYLFTSTQMFQLLTS